LAAAPDRAASAASPNHEIATLWRVQLAPACRMR
jgi:hypothetical protein